MSRQPADFDDELVDEASHSSVRTVNGDGRAVSVHSLYAPPTVGSRRAQQQAQALQREPLLAADSLAGTQSIRHAQRQAVLPPAPMPGSNGSLAPSSAAAGSGLSSASPVILGDGGGGVSDPTEFEVSYDIDNSNYALNQRHGHRQQLSLDAAEASVPDNDTAMQGTEEADARYVPEDEEDFGSGIASSSDYARFAAAGLASDSSIAFSPMSDPHGVGGSSGAAAGSGISSFEFMVSPQRFWVLFVFVFLSFNQSMIWLSFSPITKKAEAYYGISESDCDLLLNWGPIIYLPLLLPIAHVGSTARGARLMVIATAFAGLICCVLRLVPEYIDREHLHPNALWFLNAGHIINAASGPPLMATITKISCLWFAAEERTTSTAVLFMATNLGGMAGFLLGPAIVQEPDDMPTFLWVHLGCAAAAFLCTFPLHPRFFFPEKPERFPSEAAAQMQAQSDARLRGNATAVNDSSSLMAPSVPFMVALRMAVTNRSFMLLAVSNGVMQGIVSSWTGILTTVLPDSFSDEECGWFSFSSTLACIVAGISAGAATRHHALRRQLKSLVLLGTCCAMLSTALFLCLTPSILQPDSPIIASSRWSMGVAITLLGAFVGATCPLAFELGAECTFPSVPESVSASIISGFNNLSALIFLFAAPHISGAKITASLFGTVLGCTLLLLPVRSEYNRMDGEAMAEESNRTQRMQAQGAHSQHPHPSSYRPNRFHSDAYLALDDAASDYSTGSNPASSSVVRRSVLQAAHEDQMQKEFARVMQEVDEGMQPTNEHF